MKTRFLILSLGVFHVCGASSADTNAGPTLAINPQRASGIYEPGEKIIWDVKVQNDPGGTVTGASYVMRPGGGSQTREDTITFDRGGACIEETLDFPNTVLIEATLNSSGNEPVRFYGGAVAGPDKIPSSSPSPEDFDAFWKTKIAELNSVPMNVVEKKADSYDPGVRRSKITMDNIRGTHIRGQLARPEKGEKFPAMIIFQWAGIYSLEKSWVINPASKGWLVLNINAHDLPIDESKEFYTEQSKTALKGYLEIGNDDREKSYFLRMYLACYRAVDFISRRPDWDGRVLVVSGTSQGGMQSFAAAGLNPKVTALMTCVPAGCDLTGKLLKRASGWPNWVERINWQGYTGSKDVEKVTETARYYDIVNFAARVKCPALVTLGLIDTTAYPAGILAACNQLKGAKEIFIVPDGVHHLDTKLHDARSQAWLEALMKGQTVPAPNHQKSAIKGPDGLEK